MRQLRGAVFGAPPDPIPPLFFRLCACGAITPTTGIKVSTTFAPKVEVAAPAHIGNEVASRMPEEYESSLPHIRTKAANGLPIRRACSCGSIAVLCGPAPSLVNPSGQTPSRTPFFFFFPTFAHFAGLCSICFVLTNPCSG